MRIYDSLRDRLNNQHESLREIISSGDRLMRNPDSGKWSIHDNIAHLARYQPVFTDRINIILASSEPVFERYSAETDTEFESWRSKKTEDLLSTIIVDRKNLYDKITRLSESELNRIGVHKKFGRLNIIRWTEFFLLHEAHHIFTIFQLTNEAT